tara:strand:+ start:1218 stop:1844 length:627 start_codon:yes stop_codon:yes gene_type:complete
MMRWDLINFFIKKFNYKKYLELGVADGNCFNRINIESKISIDSAEGQYKYSNPTYKMTSDEFFKTIVTSEEKYDIIFIDALHHSEQVDKDIVNSLNYLNDTGTIILHDCNPLVKEHQIVPRETRAWNGDVWKSIVKFRSLNNGRGCVIPVDEGLGIIHKGVHYPFEIELPKELTWDWLVENRTAALGLSSFEDVKKMLPADELMWWEK